MTDPSLAIQAAEFLRKRWGGFRPSTFVGLGSGLGDACREMTVVDEVGFDQVPGFAPPTIAGHAGRLRAGTWSGEPVIVMLGRMHLYEGHSVERVVHPIRTAAELGVRNILLTNMSGGTSPEWVPPLLARIDAHRDLQQGWLVEFTSDVAALYSDYLGQVIEKAASEAGVDLRHGVYAGLLGPNYETPAEVRALRGLGCDMVGMSTVQEARVARELGLECAAISCVANFAAGVVEQTIDHAEVVDAGHRITPALIALLGGSLRRLADTESSSGTPTS